MSELSLDILIAGVGGQGTVLASKLLAKAALAQGCFVRTSETIGMAQRGGCVVSHVRVGSERKNPAIPLGAGDVLLGFEPAEAVRNLNRIRPEGVCVVNTRPVVPVTASLSGAEYDSRVMTKFLQENRRTVLVDGGAAVLECGSAKTLNVVLLGAAFGCGAINLDREIMLETILSSVPARFKEMNRMAFEKGYLLGNGL